MLTELQLLETLLVALKIFLYRDLNAGLVDSYFLSLRGIGGRVGIPQALTCVLNKMRFFKKE